jgi:hypothetical protein
MGLLDKLTTGGSNLTKYDGAAPPKAEAGLRTSVLHNEYSVNGTPGLAAKPAPSTLDWDGKTPKVTGKFPYLDNLPE